MATTLPPWLAIDPLAPVGRYLQGYQIGASQGQAAAAQRRAEQAAALSAQQQSEEMAFRREQAAQVAQIRQQEQALNAQKFGLELRTKQKEYEIAAEEAAKQLEGMRGFQKNKAAGMPDAQNLMENAPNLFWRHPERLAQAIHQLTPQPTTTERDVTMADTLKRSAAALRQAGDIPGAESAEYKLSLAEGKLLGPTETIETTPEGVVRIVRGGRAGTPGLTTATQGQIQQRLIGFEKALNMESELERVIKPDMFGVRGMVGSILVDKGLAQAFPELADGQRIEATALLRVFNESIIKTMKADAQVNRDEEKRLLAAVPDPNTFIESYKSAQGKLNALKKVLKGMAEVDVKALGGKTKPGFLMSYDEIVDAVRNRTLSREEAGRLIWQHHKDKLPK